jgi:2-(1,2-epoxy-1,2-dihydrophenyl)acetyl-CoA isomerase
LRPDEPVIISTAVNGTLRLQLNRPAARNAINWTMRRELHRLLTDAAQDASLRLIVLAGDNRAFCAGGDVKEMGTGPADTSAKLMMASAITSTIASMAAPVVAEVRGYASGAGFGLALACDIILVDETAVFQSPFVSRGLVPDMGTTYRLSRQVGVHKAREILLSGRDVSAEEAVALGLAAALWPGERFRVAAEEYEARLATSSREAIALTKNLVNHAPEWDFATAAEMERLAQLRAVSSDEHRSYLSAIRDGRGARG